MKKRLGSVAVIAAVILLSGCVGNTTISEDYGIYESKVYLIYSPTCPHCKALIKYIDNTNVNVSIIKTRDGKYGSYLKQFNFSWNGAVPLLFGILKNNTAIIIQGYPSEGQEKNGYFMGMEYEIKICENLNGEKIYENGKYLFCKLPTGVIMGNKYAVDYLLKICEREACEEIT